MQLEFVWVLETFSGRAMPKFWHSCTSCTKNWYKIGTGGAAAPPVPDASPPVAAAPPVPNCCTSCSSCYYSSPYFTTAVLNLVQLHFLSYSCGTAHLSYSSCNRIYRQQNRDTLLGSSLVYVFPSVS